jgi:hypothetical protein
MNLLVLPTGSILAAGDYTNDGHNYAFADQVVPISVANTEGATFVTIDTPADFTISGYTYANGALTAVTPPAPVLTPAQKFAAALAAGITVTWSTSTALNGTYAIADENQNKISAVMNGVANGLGLPGGGSTFFYLDAAGSAHAFDQAQFTAFAKAARDYVYALEIAAAGQGAFPSPDIAITG